MESWHRLSTVPQWRITTYRLTFLPSVGRLEDRPTTCCYIQMPRFVGRAKAAAFVRGRLLLCASVNPGEPPRGESEAGLRDPQRGEPPRRGSEVRCPLGQAASPLRAADLVAP